MFVLLRCDRCNTMYCVPEDEVEITQHRNCTNLEESQYELQPRTCYGNLDVVKKEDIV